MKDLIAAQKDRSKCGLQQKKDRKSEPWRPQSAFSASACLCVCVHIDQLIRTWTHSRMKRNNSQSKEVDEVVPEVVGEGGGRRNFIKMIKKKNVMEWKENRTLYATIGRGKSEFESTELPSGDFLFCSTDEEKLLQCFRSGSINSADDVTGGRPCGGYRWNSPSSSAIFCARITDRTPNKTKQWTQVDSIPKLRLN